ncbi:hypothetical protein [Aureispira anguillae]|nr:hypothetical protein [Aureispira anguillae]
MIKNVKINKEIKFTTALKLGKIHLEEAIFEVVDNQWTSFKIILKTDVETNQILEEQTFFNNNVENRLDEVEGGFNTSLPVFMELTLDADNFHLLPETSVNLVDYFDNLSTGAGLLQENSWNLLMAWQAHQLDPSIGGGTLKVGYQTSFTKPKNKIDALKRKGIVSKAVVTALIENQFPVHFNDDTQGFETKLMLENKVYATLIKPNDDAVALTIILLYEDEVKVSDKASVLQLVEKANEEITIGEFALNHKNQFSYFHHMRVSEEMVNAKWVTEMLLAGLSLMHHYHTVDLSLIKE